MNAVELLHNAARHYCIEQAAHWHRQYAELSAANEARIEGNNADWRYSEAAWRIFPRYNLLAAIQSEVERFVPADFTSVEELKTLLVAAGESAENPFTDIENAIGRHSMADERQRFVEYVARTEHKLGNLPVLPFRRVLGVAEHRQLHADFGRRWGTWYGGAVNPPEETTDAATLHTAAMDAAGAYENLRAAICRRGPIRLLELREWGDSYELDIADASFTYNGAEGFWTVQGMEWMVYASHESSITFGGKWLIEEMRKSLPLFDSYIYRGWDLSAYSVPREPAT